MNLLIIEDDNFLAEKIWNTFRKTSNFNEIKIIHSYNSFLKLYHLIETFDIILVDIVLWSYNDENNWVKIVELIRKKTDNIPIIIISWYSDLCWLDKCFKMWANDYLIKPFRLLELELRVDNWFKMFLYNKISIKKELIYYELKKELFNWEFFFNWKKIELTKKSKYILTLFIKDPEKVLSESFLIDKIWWDISSVIERNPRVNIIRLKKSLKEFWIDNWIQNVRGEWYILKKL